MKQCLFQFYFIFIALFEEEVDLIPSEIQHFSDQIRNYTFLATDKYGKTNDQLSLALMNWHCGNIHRNISYHITINNIATGKYKNDQDYIKIVGIYIEVSVFSLIIKIFYDILGYRKPQQKFSVVGQP